MRPLRIEMEGFSAFRARTVVDLTDVDLFAFVGATGAGKSSVIDAMVFALYGSVPRYGSDRLVHPAITQGKPEARVQLDFEVAGTGYTAVRVVRRTKSGATTKEARLQRGDEVLAADARSLTDAAIELLGLDLEQFTKCVVLPQGAFAALLHDTSAKRQDLLVKLLDLGVYELVAAAARRRLQDADARIAVIGGQLDQLGDLSDDALAAAEARVTATATVVEHLDVAAPTLTLLDDRARAAEAELTQVDEQLAAVTGITVPTDVATVAEEVRVATAGVVAAEAAERDALAAVEQAELARAALGDLAELRQQQQAHAQVATLTERVTNGEATVAQQRSAVQPLDEELTAAAEALRQATEALEAVRLHHAAADLARHLDEGDDCPVCGGTVAARPRFDGGALAAAEAALAEARRRHDELDADARAARTTLAGYDAKLESLGEELGAARAQLAGAPAPDELAARIGAIDAAEATLATARSADAGARRAATAAREARDRAVAAEARARAELTTVRDRLAAQGPPPLGDDLATDWERLTAWCHDRAAALEEALTAARARRAATVDERAALLAELTGAARDAGIAAPSADQLRDACVAAAADAASARARLVDQRERGTALRAELAEIAETRSVHEALVSELHPKRFEAWLLEEALGALVAGASARLEELSSGRYGIALDDKQSFEVIDHANADERRLARTLSGGETFLASLALALALAEQVAEMSPGGRTQLDAIFLDEGFGTLDPETLDVVATAIEELGASGRMVGVVSHVRELAERVPTRFEVRRAGDTAVVERVDV